MSSCFVPHLVQNLEFDFSFNPHSIQNLDSGLSVDVSIVTSLDLNEELWDRSFPLSELLLSFSSNLVYSIILGIFSLPLTFGSPICSHNHITNSFNIKSGVEYESGCEDMYSSTADLPSNLSIFLTIYEVLGIGI